MSCMSYMTCTLKQGVPKCPCVTTIFLCLVDMHRHDMSFGLSYMHGMPAIHDMHLKKGDPRCPCVTTIFESWIS